jgi:diadenosine tetraphosphate (Ap4A) HIT family hydrolase
MCVEPSRGPERRCGPGGSMGQQKVTLEHVHVHARRSGDGLVGAVHTPGEGNERNQGINFMQSKLPCASADDAMCG